VLISDDERLEVVDGGRGAILWRMGGHIEREQRIATSLGDHIASFAQDEAVLIGAQSHPIGVSCGLT